MRPHPVGTVVPPPGGGLPNMIVVVITPPFWMMRARPIGAVIRPPAGVVPGMTFIVITPYRSGGQRLRPWIELGASWCREQEGQDHLRQDYRGHQPSTQNHQCETFHEHGSRHLRPLSFDRCND